MAEGDGLSVPWEGVLPLQERKGRADLWEVGSAERERLADERERLADEREALANEREWLADRHEHLLDRRDSDLQESVAAAGEVDEARAVAAVQAALRRAEAGVRRAEAELLRARQAAARVEAGAARRVTAAERAIAAQHASQAVDAEEVAWLADRRDFVAAEREDLANCRDQAADQRDEIAGLRERLADEREREALDRERNLERRRISRPASVTWLPAGQDQARHADWRAHGERQRERAAASRRAAAHDRSRASAVWGPQAYGPTLVASFAQLARRLFGSEDVTDAVAQLLTFTNDAVAGCDWASVTLWRHGRVVDTIANGTQAAELDDLQFSTGIGPCPEVLHSRNPIYVPRLTDPARWPVLATMAGQLGVASSLSHDLFLHQSTQWSPLGTFTLYSATPEAFSDEDQEFASILAAFLAVTVAMADRRDEIDRREAALHRGLSTRDVIGQAKGILMERQRLSAGDAFDLLRRASQRLNRKLADIAQHLAETGELPK
jgi:ANTAR domain/GAF domain